MNRPIGITRRMPAQDTAAATSMAALMPTFGL